MLIIISIHIINSERGPHPVPSILNILELASRTYVERQLDSPAHPRRTLYSDSSITLSSRHWQTRRGIMFSRSPPDGESHWFDNICGRCTLVRCHERAGAAYPQLMTPETWDQQIRPTLKTQTCGCIALITTHPKPLFASRDCIISFLASANCC